MNDLLGVSPLIHVAYLIAAVMFIVGLKRLSSPASARSGNLVAAAGMAIAVVTTLFMPSLSHGGLIAAALAIGLVAGVAAARRVQMTDMPQMVALLNGLGGGAAALVATSEILHTSHTLFGFGRLTGTALASTLIGTLIGSVSFSGSMVAFGKLQGLISEKAIASSAAKVVNAALFLTVLVSAAMVWNGGPFGWFWLLLGASLALGLLVVIPIGGADMPVVISILNSCTGLAAAATGFVLHNNALIISGTLVGASGALLTQLMCKAMNRSLANVLFGGFGATPAATPGGAKTAAGPVREIGVEDAATLMSNVRSVIIVPGYGMAVAQAQHVVRELADLLAKRGVEVKYAIHPVAGRMPGHMNVLLAEANVPYEQLYDLDQVNDDFAQADVALVIGANDVVNPAARNDPSSPIYGMPILDADKARHVIVVKRSLNPGFAGIDNPIYYEDRTLMLFGDAKSAMGKVVAALKHAA